jgi:hypothetical protein
VSRQKQFLLPSILLLQVREAFPSTATTSRKSKEAHRKDVRKLKRQKNEEEDLLFREFINLAEQEKKAIVEQEKKGMVLVASCGGGEGVKKTIEQEKKGMVLIALRGGGEDDESWMGFSPPSVAAGGKK